MSRFLVALLISLLFVVVVCADTDDKLKSMGVATMAADGTITLRLRATNASDASVGEGVLIYKKDNPQYNDILKHLGGLKPGEAKNVASWPDKDDK